MSRITQVKMSNPSETVVGRIPVVARLELGIEELVLFVTEARMIVAHGGKRGAGALVTTGFFGGLSGGFEGLFKKGAEPRGKRALPHLTPKTILAADKDNFSIPYGEIVSLKVVETLYRSQLILLTGDSKFDLRTELPVEGIIELLGTRLGSKLSIERLPPDVRSKRGR